MLLTAYLGTAAAATAEAGFSRQTAVVVKPTVLQEGKPEFTLLHELLLHAYTGWADNDIDGNAFFKAKGQSRPAGSKATATVSSWLSTDFRCTPENTATTCRANTAPW